MCCHPTTTIPSPAFRMQIIPTHDRKCATPSPLISLRRPSARARSAATKHHCMQDKPIPTPCLFPAEKKRGWRIFWIVDTALARKRAANHIFANFLLPSCLSFPATVRYRHPVGCSRILPCVNVFQFASRPLPKTRPPPSLFGFWCGSRVFVLSSFFCFSSPLLSLLLARPRLRRVHHYPDEGQPEHRGADDVPRV